VLIVDIELIFRAFRIRIYEFGLLPERGVYEDEICLVRDLL
jgi:hypothetical protein